MNTNHDDKRLLLTSVFIGFVLLGGFWMAAHTKPLHSSAVERSGRVAP